MRALELVTGHLIYNPSYAYKFQLKTPIILQGCDITFLNHVFEIEVQIVQQLGLLSNHVES